MMDGIIFISGPVERNSEGELELRIPMAMGGAELHDVAKSISRIEDVYLVVPIPPWMVKSLGLTEGSIVDVDNADGKLNIRPSSPSWTPN